MRKSAVVAITRGSEVLIGRRRPELPFLGGFHAFVGGSVDPEDHNVQDPFLTCAVREVFEEANIRIQQSDLRYVGEWITPAWAPHRYHSRFFVVHLSENHTSDLSLTEDEFDASHWITPEQALLKWQTGEWLLSEPIRALLSMLQLGRESLVDEVEFANDHPREAQVLPGVWVMPLRSKTIPAGFNTPGLPGRAAMSMGLFTNTLILDGENYVIVDPGSDAPEEIARLLDFLQTRRGSCQGIFLSHHHPDHIAGLSALLEHLDVPVFCHPETAKRLNVDVVTRTINDGDQIHTGLTCWDVHWTPGHAPGHLALYEPRLKTLFAGDLVASVGTILIHPDEGDMGEYLQTLREMITLNPRTIIPSHGWVIVDAVARLNHYIDHRLLRESRVLEAVRSTGGGTPQKLVPVVYADTPPHVWPLAALSLESHLIHLERQGLVERRGKVYVPTA